MNAYINTCDAYIHTYILRIHTYQDSNDRNAPYILIKIFTHNLPASTNHFYLLLQARTKYLRKTVVFM